MKNVLTLMMFSVLFFACGETKQPENTELKNEIINIESENKEIDDIKTDIDKSTEELDELLNNL